MKRTAAAAALAALLAAETPVFGQDFRIGTTYSRRQSEYLDLDWEKTYLAVLDMGLEILRLGSYWNEIEKSDGQFDFSVLDWQLAEAEKRGIPVVLTVGMKAPRWPEYYIPDWVLAKAELKFGADVSRDPFVRDRVLRFIRTVVNRYKDGNAVHYWQVENEPLDRSGARYWWISRRFLKQEADLVRSLDPKKRPIIVNVMTYPNKFLRRLARVFFPTRPVPDALSVCDILGIDIYPVVGHQFWRQKLYFWTSEEERAEYFGNIRRMAERRGKKVWVMELQAEPWEPGLLVHKSAERPPTGWPEMSETSFLEFKRLGFGTILLWGAEYWHFRHLKHQDRNWLQMAVDFVQSRRLEANRLRELEAADAVPE